MLTIALTGGIGSGKTTVTELFSQLGIPVIDADSISRELLSESINAGPKHSPHQALLEVKDLFGKHLFDQDGYLKRAELRQAVFSSASKKQQLETILHPLVYDEIFQLIDKIKTRSPPYIIIAIPLLLETRQQHLFDKVLVIDSSPEEQLARTQKRDNSTAKLAQAIIESQVDRKTRLNAADYIIRNSTSLDELKKQVSNTHQLLLKTK